LTTTTTTTTDPATPAAPGPGGDGEGWSLADLSRTLSSLVEGRLWLKVLIGLVCGVIVGVLLGPTTGLVSAATSQTVSAWLALPGQLFLRLVQMIMVPLIISSIVQGIAGGDSGSQLKSLGPGVAVYFLVTTAVAVLIGTGLALLIRPGELVDAVNLGVDATAATAATATKMVSAAEVPQVISQLLPTNPLASMVTGEMLSVVIFAVVSGVALSELPKETAAPMMQVLHTVQHVCMTVTKWAMRLAPVAVFGLMSQVVTRVGLKAIIGLGAYVGTVLAGLLIIVALYALGLALFSSIGPRRFFREAREVLLLAFSMASSAGVMPLSLKTAEERLGVTPAVARFIIPVGATINMNGTAAYQAIAALFLAQVYGLDLSLPAILVLVVTTVAASLGTPSSPGAGVVILASILTSAGIPVAGVALIIGVDNLLGMCRASVNVMGDLVAAVLFDRRRASDAAAP
jgi:Na+/H+-dicarboxylate symporter